MNNQQYQRTYVLSLLVWSGVILGGLVGGPKIIETAEAKASNHQFQQTYIEPIQRKIEALESAQGIAKNQHQQEIDTLKETIEILERDIQGHYPEMNIRAL
ncbi:MAG: hypothetical protein ACFB0D_22125 [Phormidesmis sp.]